MENVYATNTLRYDASKCSGCRMCSTVCPHRVFEQSEGVAQLVRYELCMECGACSLNCPTGAIEVESGVGCAAALMLAALKGVDEADAVCGPDDGACCGKSAGAGADGGSRGSSHGSCGESGGDCGSGCESRDDGCGSGCCS